MVESAKGADTSAITIVNRQRAKRINLRLLKQITDALLVELKIENAELGISLVAAKEMAQVNWKFLRHEGSTDVITFDHAEKWKQVYGELFVCADDAIQQAKKFKTSWQSEIVRYVVHGVLHLLGYDDHRAAGRQKMKREENRLLRKLSARFALSRL